MSILNSLLELTPIGRTGIPLAGQAPTIFLVQIDTDHCFPKDKTSTVFGDTREFLHNLKVDLAAELSLLSGKNSLELCRSVKWTEEVILNSPPLEAPLVSRTGIKAWKLSA